MAAVARAESLHKGWACQWLAIGVLPWHSPSWAVWSGRLSAPSPCERSFSSQTELH